MTDPAQHDFLAQVLIFLGQYVIDNADSIGGKIVGLAPVGLGGAGIAAGLVEGAFLKVGLKALGGAIQSLGKKEAAEAPKDEVK